MSHASVVIATFNRLEQLRRCLAGLASQRVSAEAFDVIVVVDGSTDGTAEWLDQIQTPYALRVIRQENRGQPAALNRGAAIADGRTCIFLDDDIMPTPELVGQHLTLHEQRKDVVGIGQLALELPDTADWFARAFAADWRAHYDDLNQLRRSPGWQDCYGGNMSLDREHFIQTGGFDTTLKRAFDTDLAYRLAREGCSFAYLPDALGIQDQQKRLRALTRDSEQSGIAWVDLYRRYPELLTEVLGTFSLQRQGIATTLRLLLALDIPPARLASAATMLQSAGGARLTYQLLQRYSFWRGVHHAMSNQDGFRYLTGGTPVLMYHAFAGPGEPASRYVVPVQRFARQIAWLKRTGHVFIDLQDLIRYRRQNQLPPSRAVAITIDDGYTDALDLAYPVLRRYGVPATIFVVSQRVGLANDWDDHGPLAGRPLLSRTALRSMCRQGVRFGAHACSHPDLTSLSAECARLEIAKAKADLECTLQTPILTFAYPYGKYSRSVTPMVEEAGYVLGCGINPGLNTPATSPYGLCRVEVRGTDSWLDFALAVRFGARREVLGKRLARMVSGMTTAA
jgi:peptidoglycan/xylan/chitin deacetylase (PgdA/CDA1 family)/GT2 family glycosyltransferase